MECRNLKITLVSAENLPNPRSYRQMKVYAEVSLNGDSKSSKKTTTDMVGETNPRWNMPLDFKIAESSINEKELKVVVKLYCERTRGDKYIGEVEIPVKILFDSGIKTINKLSRNVLGTPSGRLNILYSFGDCMIEDTKPSAESWKKAIGVAQVGAMVMIQGAWLLLTGDVSFL